MNKYSILGGIGEGAHGLVLKAKHLPSGAVVALKKLHVKSLDEGIPINIMREIKTLQHTDSKHVIKLYDVFPHGMSFILVMEYMCSGLWEMLHDLDYNITEPQIKTYSHMLLKGVKYLHDHFIMHRDLKPANLLIDSKGVLKIADLGLARLFWPDDNSRPYSHQVATRWYRAPELLYGAKYYNQSVDLWAVGCIVAEMINGQPLFAGDTDIEQLAIVLRHLGTPTKENWPELENLPDFNKISFPDSEPTPWSSMFPCASEEGRHFIKGFILYDPSKRMSPEKALQHSWFDCSPLPATMEEMPKPNEEHRSLLKQQTQNK